MPPRDTTTIKRGRRPVPPPHRVRGVQRPRREAGATKNGGTRYLHSGRVVSDGPVRSATCRRCKLPASTKVEESRPKRESYMPDPIEREIEELLLKLDSFVPEAGEAPERSGGGRRDSHWDWFSRKLKGISLIHVMTLSMSVVLVTLVVRNVPGAGWLILFAVTICLAAFAFSLIGSHDTNSICPGSREKRWRGPAH